MKSIKKNLKQTSLIFLMFSAVFLGLITRAQAQNPLSLPSVSVSGIAPYAGQYISVIYTVATAAGMALQAEHLTVNTIYKQTQPLLISGNSALFAAEHLAWTGTAKPNAILIIIHRTPNFTWVNGANNATAITAITTKQAIELARATARGTININF